MTTIAGYNLCATPCCGAIYRALNYRSMNFSAWEYWTDGYREGTLMPNDHGLRQCLCGALFLVKEMEFIEHVEETNAPHTSHVADTYLPVAIAQARTSEIELAARLDYWQLLNHPYRVLYRAHSDSKKAAWISANPDQRSWWQRICKAQPPKYVETINQPSTYPLYELSEMQRDNLKALLRLHEEELRNDNETRAELHRELGQFEQAMQALQEEPIDEGDFAKHLIWRLIISKVNAPMFYRI